MTGSPLIKEQTQQLNMPIETTASEIFHHLQHDWNFGGLKLDINQAARTAKVAGHDEQPMTSSYCNMLNQRDLASSMNSAGSSGSISTEIVQDDSHTTGGDCILQDAVADLIDDNSVEDNVDNVDDEAEAEEDEEDLDDNDAVRDIVDELQQQHEQIMQLQQQQQQQHQLHQVEIEHFQQQQERHNQQQLQHQQHQQHPQMNHHHLQNHHHGHLNEYVGEVSCYWHICKYFKNNNFI